MSRPIPQIAAITVTAAKRGDTDAHARLYETFAPMIFTLARRMLASATLAEDVLQEAFVEVIRGISSYRGDAEFGCWVRRVAVNRCLAHLRSPWLARRAERAEPTAATVSSCDEQMKRTPSFSKSQLSRAHAQGTRFRRRLFVPCSSGLETQLQG
jgi:RNA polymerase sigma factor (sigma-70 family)